MTNVSPWVHAVAGQTIGTLKSSNFDSLSALNFPVVWYQLCSVPSPELSLLQLHQNYDRVIAFAPNCGESLFHGVMAPLRHSTTIELSSPFKLMERFDLGFRVFSPMLSSHYQPYGGRGTVPFQRHHIV